MMKICRFCLLEDEEYLIPVADASELAIDIEEVALFSGIRVSNSVLVECPTLTRTSRAYLHLTFLCKTDRR